MPIQHPDTPPYTPKARIYIMEDECIVAEDIAIRLTDLGYEIVGIHACAEDALTTISQARPDLVLMDIHLQGDMDGITLAQELRQQYRIPVVFLTAYAEAATFQRAKSAEPFGYVLKPFEDRELEIVIEMAIAKHQAEEAMQQKFHEIERFNKITEGRELRMIELKKEINALLNAAGQPAKYTIVHDA